MGRVRPARYPAVPVREGFADVRSRNAERAAAENAKNEAKQDQPESVSNEWVPQQEAKIASC